MTDSPAPKQITGKTKIMFILGDPWPISAAPPSSTSISCAAVSMPLHRRCRSRPRIWERSSGDPQDAQCRGLRRHLPHKIEVLRHLDATTEQAAQVGR